MWPDPRLAADRGKRAVTQGFGLGVLRHQALSRTRSIHQHPLRIDRPGADLMPVNDAHANLRWPVISKNHL
jgi:hypothetical protein